MSQKQKIIGLVVAVILLCLGCYYAFTNKEELALLRAKPEPATTVSVLNKVDVTVQRLVSPQLTTTEINKVLGLFIRHDNIFLALRNEDNTGGTLTGLTLKDNILHLAKGFGKNGTKSIPGKMILDIDLDDKDTIYFTHKGVHALKDGSLISSLEGKTSANKILLQEDGKSAYLYGNDSFELVTINDGSCDELTSGFLQNRAAPFLGGLTQLALADDKLYAGGRLQPHGVYSIIAFDSKHKQLQQYGPAEKLNKAAIYNLLDMAILDDYVLALDGFTTKFWSKDGKFLGTIPNDSLLGSTTSALKAIKLSGNTALILGYTHDANTGLAQLSFSTLTL